MLVVEVFALTLTVALSKMAPLQEKGALMAWEVLFSIGKEPKEGSSERGMLC